MELDSALEKLGHWGKFQIINYSLLSLPVVFYAVYEFTYIFTAKQVLHRCYIPECETNPLSTEFEPPWLTNAVPFKDGHPTKCQRYVPLGDFKYDNGTCPADAFTKNVTSCSTWVYEKQKISILSEWDLTCDENSWKLTLVGTISNLGRLFGSPISGFLSDRYGRRTVLLSWLFFSGVAGLLQSFSVNYAMFIAFVFIDPLFSAGLFSAAFILGMELLGPNKRVVWNASTHCTYSMGEALLGVVAWQVQDWRWMLRAFYGPAILSIAALWFLPESVKWLVSKGRIRQAKNVIRKAARMNGISAEQLGLEESSTVTDDKNPVNGEIKEKIPLLTALKKTFQSKIIVCRLLNCLFCWVTITFTYYGLSVNSVNIGGNEYLNFIMVALIEIPASIVTYFLMEKIGHRASLSASLTLSGVSCLAFCAIPEGMKWINIAACMFGKFGITISFCVIYVITAELFPTSVRHTLFATCSMFSRFGSLAAPQTPLLASYMKTLPIILFGCMALTSGFTSLLFPETHGTRLPDSVQEAENIGKNLPKPQNKSENLSPNANKNISTISGSQATAPGQ